MRNGWQCPRATSTVQMTLLCKGDLWNGFILNDLQRDLIAIIVVRAYARLAAGREKTDATLRAAYDLLQDPLVAADR